MISIAPERFAQGMTFDEYVAFMATPENLRREGSGGAPRVDRSDFFRRAYAESHLTDAQSDALRWLVAQSNGPAKMLVISEEWSSDCRRDVPTFARMATDAGMELRIFPRDGQKFSTANVPTLAEAPDSNADLMAQFLNHKNGQTFQSIPVCAFFTRDMQHLYHFIEYPALYDKEGLVVQRIRAARPGESPEAARSRSDREFGELMDSPFWKIWTSATINETLSMLHHRLTIGQ